MSSVKFVQISDTHIFATPDEVLLGVPTRISFEAAVGLIAAEKNLDFIIHTGDVSQDGSERSYQFAAHALSQFNVPVYYIPGNHDHMNVMNSVFPCERMQANKQIIINNLQFILLNSQIPGSVEGRLEKDELMFLENCLIDYPKLQGVVIFHHHPYLVNTGWLDPLGLQNADELFMLLKKYPQVKNIIFGHIHQINDKKMNGIDCYSAPSTCIQFKSNIKEFSLDDLTPGIRVYEFFDDGRVKTEVKRVSKYIGKFDKNAKGY